jgi:hypothetical protein
MPGPCVAFETCKKAFQNIVGLRETVLVCEWKVCSLCTLARPERLHTSEKVQCVSLARFFSLLIRPRTLSGFAIFTGPSPPA